MKKRGKRSKISRRIKTNKDKAWKIGIAIGIILILVVLYFSFKDKLTESNIKLTKPTEISPLELVQNKEKYENKTIKITNALIPDPNFIYVKENSTEEKIFIKPTKSTYCLYFNVTGKLERDNTFRKWVFLVDKFECVSKT